MKTLLSALILVCFFINTVIGACPCYAQGFSVNDLPVPGTMVGESVPFTPLALKGLIVNLQKPLEFQFIVDTGRGPQDTATIKDQANQLVKYFLAGLTIPEGDLWVNLSPYEKNRVVPDALGQTDLGRDLLAQDYILKQLTASLIYPEKNLGKEFWSRVYARARQQFGTTNIPINTFNKVWILPDQAQVFEHGAAAYVTKATLKVMLDEDYTALQKHMPIHNGTDSIDSQIVRQIILPEIEKEVNTGKNFATLRQIYQALILAKWYKETIQNGLLDAVYTNKNKVAGVNLNDPSLKEQIYNRYLQAYKKGAFNYIKEDPTPDGQVVPRKYFSGGITHFGDFAMSHEGKAKDVRADGAMAAINITLKMPDAAMKSRSLSSPEYQGRFYDRFKGDIQHKGLLISLIANDTKTLELILNSITKNIKPKDKVLSIGEGQGHLAQALQQRGINIEAIDASKENTKSARAKGVKQTVGDAHHLKFPDKSFDVLIFVESIGALNLQESLKEAFRVLRPGGRILIVTHPVLLPYSHGKMTKEFPYIYYSYEDIKDALQQAGFTKTRDSMLGRQFLGLYLITATKGKDNSAQIASKQPSDAAMNTKLNLLKEYLLFEYGRLDLDSKEVLKINGASSYEELMTIIKRLRSESDLPEKVFDMNEALVDKVARGELTKEHLEDLWAMVKRGEGHRVSLEYLNEEIFDAIEAGELTSNGLDLKRSRIWQEKGIDFRPSNLQHMRQISGFSRRAIFYIKNRNVYGTDTEEFLKHKIPKNLTCFVITAKVLEMGESFSMFVVFDAAMNVQTADGQKGVSWAVRQPENWIIGGALHGGELNNISDEDKAVLKAEFIKSPTEFENKLKLTSNEIIVLQERFFSDTPIKFQNLSKKYGKSYQRWEQIYKKLINKINKYLTAQRDEDTFYEDSLYRLGLKTKTLNSLKRLNIRNVSELCQWSRNRLLNKQGLNESVQEIEDALGAIGKHLSNDPAVELPKIRPLLPTSDINVLKLNIIIEQFLIKHNILTIGKLIRHSAADLLSFNGMRKAYIQEIRKNLNLLGLRLRGEELINMDAQVTKESSIDTLNLKEGVWKKFTLGGIFTIRQLLKYTASDLLRIYHWDPLVIKEIQAALNKHGFVLRDGAMNAKQERVDNELKNVFKIAKDIQSILVELNTLASVQHDSQKAKFYGFLGDGFVITLSGITAGLMNRVDYPNYKYYKRNARRNLEAVQGWMRVILDKTVREKWLAWAKKDPSWKEMADENGFHFLERLTTENVDKFFPGFRNINREFVKVLPHLNALIEDIALDGDRPLDRKLFRSLMSADILNQAMTAGSVIGRGRSYITSFNLKESVPGVSELPDVQVQGVKEIIGWIIEEVDKNAMQAALYRKPIITSKEMDNQIILRIQNASGTIDFDALRQKALRYAQEGLIRKSNSSHIIFVTKNNGKALDRTILELQNFHMLLTRTYLDPDSISQELNNSTLISPREIESLPQEDLLKIIELGKVGAAKINNHGVGLPLAFLGSGMDLAGYELKLVSNDPTIFEIRLQKAPSRLSVVKRTLLKTVKRIVNKIDGLIPGDNAMTEGKVEKFLPADGAMNAVETDKAWLMQFPTKESKIKEMQRIFEEDLWPVLPEENTDSNVSVYYFEFMHTFINILHNGNALSNILMSSSPEGIKKSWRKLQEYFESIRLLRNVLCDEKSAREYLGDYPKVAREVLSKIKKLPAGMVEQMIVNKSWDIQEVGGLIPAEDLQRTLRQLEPVLQSLDRTYPKLALLVNSIERNSGITQADRLIPITDEDRQRAFNANSALNNKGPADVAMMTIEKTLSYAHKASVDAETVNPRLNIEYAQEKLDEARAALLGIPQSASAKSLLGLLKSRTGKNLGEYSWTTIQQQLNHMGVLKNTLVRQAKQTKEGSLGGTDGAMLIKNLVKNINGKEIKDNAGNIYRITAGAYLSGPISISLYRFKDRKNFNHIFTLTLKERNILFVSIALPEGEQRNGIGTKLYQLLAEEIPSGMWLKGWVIEGKTQVYLAQHSSEVTGDESLKKVLEATVIGKLRVRAGLTNLEMQYEDEHNRIYTGINAFRLLKRKILLGIFPAFYLLAQKPAGQPEKTDIGGINLNQIDIKRTGKTINVQFDPAQLNELEQSDFKGFTPVITDFGYIQSPFQLLGINDPAKKSEELAKA